MTKPNIDGYGQRHNRRAVSAIMRLQGSAGRKEAAAAKRAAKAAKRARASHGGPYSVLEVDLTDPEGDLNRPLP